MPYAHKHKPEKTKDIIGQDNVLVVLNAVKSWKKCSRPLLIHGPPGTGKTIAAEAIASELGLDFIEVNASDTRNREEINQNIGSALRQRSLFSTGKLILIDEVDGLSGHEDRGGIQAIAEVIKDSPFPVILTATNPWDNKFSALRKRCQIVEFLPLSHDSVFRILAKVCCSEKIAYDEIVLKSLARRSSGDARSALNDLESLAYEARELTKKSLEALSDRNREDTILNALVKVFKTTDIHVACSAFDNVHESLDEQMLWLDENLPKEYTNPLDLERAYDMLSKADILKSRIRRRQHWRFLVYVTLLITAGIAVSKDSRYPGMVKYTPTGKLLKIWLSNQKSMKKKAIAEKIAAKTHTSKKEALKSVLPYIEIAFKNNPALRESMIEEMGLSDEEAEWMGK